MVGFAVTPRWSDFSFRSVSDGFSFKPVTVNALCNMCGNCLHFLFIEEELLKRMKANKHPHHPV